MDLYPKIHSVFKRDEKGKFLFGEWARDEFWYLADNAWLWTEKVDGTNIRIGLDADSKFRIGGRTERAQIPVHLLDAIQDLELEGKLRERFQFGEGYDEPPVVCLYGEGYGPKIQKGGGNYRDTPGFVLFDVKVGQWWLRRPDVESIAEALELDVVPAVGVGAVNSISDAIRRVRTGLTSSWGDFPAEGLVGIPKVPLLRRDGRRVMVKVKTKDFKHE